MTRFLLIRHAITDSAGKRLTGRTGGVHLNEEGRVQAQALAERLAHLPISMIYSSPLERALETAEPLAKALGMQTMICEDVTEMNFGEWTNCTIEELKEQPRFQLFNSFRSCTQIPGGESMPGVQVRMITALEKLRLRHPTETIVVVSHSDVIKAAVTYYAGIPLDLFQRIEISPASVSIVEMYEETARIVLVNDTGVLKIA